MKHNLVIVRAGDSSLHPKWLASASASTNWELWVSYFGDAPDQYRSDGLTHIDGPGPKFPALKHLLASLLGRIMTRYKYVWLPDDDLDCDPQGIDLFFSLCKRFELKLAQPSLTDDSFISHPTTMNNPNYLIRFTDYVESMAPCFRVDAFAACLPTFDENISGWGLDHLWPLFLCPISGRIGIVDAVQMRHTRAFGGPNYIHVKRQNTTPQAEIRALVERHRLRRPLLITIAGAVDLTGRELSAMEFRSQRNLWWSAPW